MKNAAPPQKKESSNRYQLDCDGKLHALISFFFQTYLPQNIAALIFFWYSGGHQLLTTYCHLPHFLICLKHGLLHF